MSETPKPLLHKSSSAPASAQSCMKTWLKTKVCSPIDSIQKQNKMKGSDKRSESYVMDCSHTPAEMSKDSGIEKNTSLKSFRILESQPSTASEKMLCNCSEREATAVGCSNCGQSSASGSDSFHPYSSTSSETASSSCDHSGCVSSESDFSSPVCAPKRLDKISALILEPQSLETQELPSSTLILEPQSLETQELPSSHEVENVSPPKIKRRFNSGSPVSSPKRPCLTKIESNYQAQNALFVMKNLFSDKMNATSETIKTAPTNTSATIAPHLKEVAGKNACFEETLSKLSKETDEDLNSPTMNLPNLVLDEVNTKATPARVKTEASPGRDWLTCLRMERRRKTFDYKQVVATSPKVKFHYNY